MVELENTLVPQLNSKMPLWYQYVDDTFTFLHKGEIENIKYILNSFHNDINFTHEVEKDGTISFLDDQITRSNNGTFITKVHRKETDTNIYLHWNAFAPNIWKIGTLKGLFRRAYMICSTKTGLDQEIKHLKYVFIKINGYPSRIVHKTLQEVIRKIETEKSLNDQSHIQPSTVIGNNSANETEVNPYFCIPYKGKEGENLIYKFKSYVNRIMPSNVKPNFTYKGKKLGSYFRVKDKVHQNHQHNLVYGYLIQNDSGNPGYIGETRVRYEARTNEHINTDKESSIFKYHKNLNTKGNKDHFLIYETGYSKDLDRKIAESLYIKQFKPSLNNQADSLKLKLFN